MSDAATDAVEKCGYCGNSLVGTHARTAGGRPFCPRCGSIPKAYQREGDR